jgi:hypothetical protein
MTAAIIILGVLICSISCYKIGYWTGYGDGWLAKDNEATDECERCALRQIRAVSKRDEK